MPARKIKRVEEDPNDKDDEMWNYYDVCKHYWIMDGWFWMEECLRHKCTLLKMPKVSPNILTTSFSTLSHFRFSTKTSLLSQATNSRLSTVSVILYLSWDYTRLTKLISSYLSCHINTNCALENVQVIAFIIRVGWSKTTLNNSH